MPTPTKLTPYDTGERCEPKVWLPYGTEITDATPAGNFGKVDFDDDEAHTVVTVYVSRNDDGTHTVQVIPFVDEDQLRVTVHPEPVV